MAVDPQAHKKKLDKVTLKAIKDIAQGLHQTANKVRAPELCMPVRALSNVTYDKRAGHFVIGRNGETVIEVSVGLMSRERWVESA